MTSRPLRHAVELVGLGRLARECGVTYQALQKWEKAGRLPRTEWTGETDYSTRIAALTSNQVTREQLLAKWPAVTLAPKVNQSEPAHAAA